jgi:hypothetical protein
MIQAIVPELIYNPQHLPALSVGQQARDRWRFSPTLQRWVGCTNVRLLLLRQEVQAIPNTRNQFMDRTTEPGLGSHSGQVGRRERLGGVLSYYYRDVA